MWEIMLYKKKLDRPLPERSIYKNVSQAMDAVGGYYHDEGSEPFWGNDELVLYDGDVALGEIRQISAEPVQEIMMELDDNIEFDSGRFGQFTDQELWLFVNLLGTTVARANTHTRKLLQEVVYEQKMRYKNIPEE